MGTVVIATPRRFAWLEFMGVDDHQQSVASPLGQSLQFLKLPTDPVGTTTVTFSGVTVGSEIHVYLPDGTELTGTESCTANQQLTWQVYAPGSPNNTVSITLIKRGIRPQKFEYLSSVGNKTIPLFPQPDLGYNNPA